MGSYEPYKGKRAKLADIKISKTTKGSDKRLKLMLDERTTRKKYSDNGGSFAAKRISEEFDTAIIKNVEGGQIAKDKKKYKKMRLKRMK